MYTMWFSVVLIVCSVSCISSQGFYKVTGPRAVRPNSEYHAAVSIQATSLPTTVTVSLLGQSFEDGRPFRVDDVITVSPYSSRISRLEVPDIKPGNYRLVVEGRGGIAFEDSRPLQYYAKSYSVFVQTDKGVYKPGDKIFFRALVLNPQLKPAAEARTEPIDVHISDGHGNKVKEWRRAQSTGGVFTGELQLSGSPNLGNWNISVTVQGQNYNKTIQVAQYIMPKFLINIQAPQHITFEENILTVNIQTSYNYGKKVRGDATVTVYPTIYSGVLQPIFQNPIRKVIPIDGSATVNFDVAKELRLSDEYERTVIVDVTVEEALTGRRQNNSVEVHIHKYDYKMELVKTADYYKPGLKYTAYVKVTNNDGSPIAKDRREIKIRHGYSRVDEVYALNIHRLDNNGVLTLELYPPRNSTNETALRIEAEYYNLKERMSPIPAAVSASNTFVQATVETDRPMINLDVEISINCTEPMKYINYELIGRGDVLIANTYQVDDKTEYRFHFTATHAMVPVSHLLVNYVRSDGELVADSVDIEIDGLLQNFIDVQVNTFETQPNTEIDLTVRAKPNSFVGLLAVDQNAARLKSGYDLTQSYVSEDMLQYDLAGISPYSAVMRDAKSHFFWKPGGSNSADTYYDSGALILTNAIVYNYRPTLEDIYLRPVSYGSSTVKPDRGIGITFHSVTRPPLAGPYAFSRIPRPVWDKPKVYLTQNVADTWLFTNFSSGYEGKVSIRRRLPNTLNTWVITGFSLDFVNGLGLVSNPKKLKVSKPIVVSCDLPHSVQRGEIVEVPVVVFNNLDRDINAEVTLHNPDQKFEFPDTSNSVTETKKIELYRRKRVSVKRNSGNSVSFVLTALKQGYAEIKISASVPGSQDTLTKELLVMFEGETQYYTKSLLIDLRNSPTFVANVSFDIPKNVVQDSEKLEVSAVGDLLGPVMVNLENLMRLPTGCGEQNLVHFMPDLIILNYLRNSGQLTPAIEVEAVRNLESSYQQQLSFRMPDGSFRVFGETDTTGSVWVTAYVASALSQARTYIYIDESVLERSLQWLADRQSFNGSFVETGNVIHELLQSKNGKSLAITAYTILAFLENHQYPIYRNLIEKALDYIARNLDEEENVYTITICSYALQLANHPSRQSAFNLLDSRAKTNRTRKWWAQDVPKNEMQSPWTHLPRSVDIEATAYGLLTFIEMNLLEDAVPVLDWLLEQRNSLGGFTSSQDTVVGLHALYKLSLKLSSNADVEIEYSVRERQKRTFKVNRNNALIVQKAELPKDVRLVNVTARGRGLALFRVSYQYNMNVTGPWPLFTLDPQVDKNSNIHHLQVSICTAFVNQNVSESNMAVMEVNFPSGFTADVDSLPSLEVSENVQKVETRNDDTQVLLYFNNLTRTEYCPTVSAYKTHKVASQQPVAVVVYDYYDSSRRARIFYTGSTATLCDVCEGEDCGDVCTSRAGKQLGSDGAREGKSRVNGANKKSLSILLLVFNVMVVCCRN